jgi:hypothetical protein
MRDASLVKWYTSDLSVTFLNIRASSDLLNAGGGDFGAPGPDVLGDAAT